MDTERKPPGPEAEGAGGAAPGAGEAPNAPPAEGGPRPAPGQETPEPRPAPDRPPDDTGEPEETPLERTIERIERITQHVPAPVRKFLFRRVVAELLGIATLVVVLLSLVVRTDAFRERVRSMVEAEATLALRRPVRIGAVSARAFPPKVVLAGVEITEDPRGGGGAMVSVDSIEVETGWVPVRHDGLRLAAVTARGLRARLRRFDDGSWNFPRPAPSKGDSSLRVERLRVIDGRLSVGGRELPVEGEAKLSAEWLEVGGAGEHRLGLGVPSATLRGAGGEPVSASGRLSLRIAGERIELDELSITSDLGSLHSSGRVAHGVRVGKGQLGVSGLVRTGPLDRFLGSPVRMSGEVALAGNLEFAREGAHFVGSLRSDELRLRGARVEKLTTSIDAAEARWKLTVEEAIVGGGKITGSVAGGAGRPFAVELSSKQVGLDAILVPLVPRFPRVDARIDLEAKGEGKGELASWKGSLSAKLAPGGGAGTPVTGAVDARVEAGRVVVGALALQAGGAHVRGDGEIALRGGTGSFRFRAETDDLAAAQKLCWATIPLSPGFVAAFPPLEGRLSAEGTLGTGGPALFALDSRIRVEEARAAERPMGTVTGRLRADSGSLEAEGALLSLEDGAELRLSGRVFDFHREKGPVLDLDIRSRRFPLETAFAILHLKSIDVTGRVTGHLALHGPALALDGSGPIELDEPLAWGQSATRATGTAGFDQGAFSLDDVRLVLGGGSARAKARFEADGHGFSFDGDFTDVPLTALDLVRPHLPKDFDAKLSGTASGRGTYDAPELETSGSVSAARVLGRLLTAEKLLHEAKIAGGRLAASLAGPGGLAVRFEAPLHGGRPDGTWSAKIDDFSAYREWLGLAAKEVAADGRLAGSGTVVVTGGETLPRWRAPGHLESFAWKSGPIEASLAAPAEMTLDELRLSIGTARLEGSLVDATLAGEIGFGPDKAVRARLAGRADTSILHPFLPEKTTLVGPVSFDLRADGPFAAPALAGRLDLGGCDLASPGLVDPIENLTGRIDLHPGRLLAESITATMAGGRLELAGSARLDGFVPSDFRARLAVGAVPIRGVEGLDLVVSGSLLATGSSERVQIRGDVTVDQALYTDDFRIGIGDLLGRSTRSVSRAAVTPWTDRIELEIRLKAPGTLAVRNSMARLAGDADLVLRGTIGHPSLLGQARLLEGGEIDFQGAKYEVTSGTVFFSDPSRFDPVFDVTAQAEIHSYQVRLNLTGTLARVKPTFSSDPPLSETNILYLILSGQSPEDLSTNETATSMEARVTEMTQRTISTLTFNELNRRGRELFGLDRFTIDPVFGTNNQLDTARITVGKRVSRDLTVTYSYNPQAGKEQILTLEYRLGRSAFLTGTRDAEGVFGFDVKMRHRF